MTPTIHYVFVIEHTRQFINAAVPIVSKENSLYLAVPQDKQTLI